MAKVTHEILLTREVVDYEDGYIVRVAQTVNGLTVLRPVDGGEDLIELTPTMARLVAKALCESADEQERRMEVT